MKLQNLLLPQTGICTEECMYFRKFETEESKVDFTWDKDYIPMEKETAVSFDTYFNGCSVEKWFKYTKVRSISLHLHLKGQFRVTLMRKEKKLDGHTTRFLREETVGEENVEGNYSFLFESESNNGMLCFGLKCMSEEGVVYGGWYEGEVPQEEIRRVKMALVICTFKREVFVTKNVKELTESFLDNPESDMSRALEIFISDNARTLDPKDIVLNDKIHLFQNKNTGGAGGFTRGMIEVMKCREKHGISHILVMDDDVIINPESLYRTYVILSLLKDNYEDAFVGGAMLRLDQQFIQHEAGARWNKGYLISHKCGLDLREVDGCIYNEWEEKTDFNAWWYCAFPAKVVSEDNLPLPIFIRGDDVEYGLRNMKNLILMNGICVWHEPFENKYSSSMYYYIFRNRLIDNSIHHLKYKRRNFIKDLSSQVKHEIVLYRYKNAELLMDGVQDFFRGIDWFMQQDGEALHKDVMARGYKMQDINDLPVPFSYPVYERACRMEEPGRLRRMFRKLMVNGLLLPAHKTNEHTDPFIAPTYTARPLNFYRADKVLNYDYTSRKGFVTEKSLKKTWTLMLRLEGIAWKSRFRYRRLVKQYDRRSAELMKLDFWNKYLDL